MIRINSDFIDYYDHWAAGSWQSCDCVLDRRMDSGPARKEALEILSASGFNVPRNGIVEALVSEIIGDAVDPVRRWMMESINLVVYTDEKAHAGEGKVLLSMESALCDFPKLFACEYLPTDVLGVAESYRYLRVGSRQFWLKYTSSDDWRSNCGDVDVEFICEELPSDVVRPTMRYPLYAIDFILAGRLYAVDLNVSPKICGTGVENLMTSLQAYEQIATMKKRIDKVSA